MKVRNSIACVAFGLSALLATAPVQACPFCSAVAMTFCEEIGSADVAVIAKLVEIPPQSADGTQNATATTKPARFAITEVLKGEERLGKSKQFETLYFGNEPVGKEFLAMGMDEKDKIAWSTPIAITAVVPRYLKSALALPKEGPDRLAFFQDYLEGSDEMLARDAYDEFAKAPYSVVLGLKDHMKHDKLLEWIQNPKVSASHRRLYLTMLGVCGTPKDAQTLEDMIKVDSPTPKPGMDALIASYLTLKGPSGLPIVEDQFLKNKDAEYTETYAAIMALRFHGQEEKIIPKERLVESLRYMLDRPQLADLVIPDLARWEDWGSMDKLVKLFKEATDESSWVKVPVVNYLRACPLPAAKEHLKELAKLDPESVKRAESFFPFGGGAAPVPAGKADDKSPPSTEKKPAEASKPMADDKAPELSADEIPDAGSFVKADDAGPLLGQATLSSDDAVPAPEEEPAPAAPAVADSPKETTKSKEASALREPGNAPTEAAAVLPVSSHSSTHAPASPTGVLSGMALAGLTLFLVMAAIIRGGQHVSSSS